MYEQTSGNLERSKERREALKRAMLQAMSKQSPTQMVSGRAVSDPYSPMSKIGQALIYKNALGRNKEEQLEAEQAFGEGREAAFTELKDTYFGRKANMPEAVDGAAVGPSMPATEGSPIEAAMFAAQNPYLSDSGISKSIMPSKDRGRYSRPIKVDIGDGKYQWGWANTRDQTYSPMSYDDQKLYGTEDDDVNASMKPVLSKTARSEAEIASKVTEAKKSAELGVDREFDEPKAASRVAQASKQLDVVKTNISKVRENISNWTVGAGGWAMQAIPWSDRNMVENSITTLKASVAAENLQMMRESSPTGGAMGNISDKDIELLQTKAGALNPDLKGDAFVQQLDEFEAAFEAIIHGKYEIYNAEYPNSQIRPSGGELPEGFVVDP